MKVLVTRTEGNVGARLFQDLRREFHTDGAYFENGLFPGLRRVNLREKDQASALLREVRPDVIVHPSDISGIKNLVDAANEIDARIIYISTTGARKPHDKLAQNNSLNEMEVRGTNAGYLILRRASIIGRSPDDNSRKFHNLLLRNIIHGTPAIYDNSATLQPTWLGHLSEVTITAIQRNIDRETIPVLTDHRTTRFEVARVILQAFEVECSPERKKGYRNAVYASEDKLRSLGLPTYTYGQVVAKVISEISAQREESRSIRRYSGVL